MTIGHDSPLQGLKVLLVEDEFLIALDAEEILRSLGAAHVKTISTYEEASRQIESGGFDIAVLDVNLNGQLSFPLGEALKRRGRQFVFASGYNLDSRAGLGMEDVVCVAKPYDREGLKSAVIRALGRSSVCSA